MDIKEKAKEYAKGKMTEAIEKVIADAYAEGYRAGYKDKSDEIPPVVKNDEDVEFVDLGLPSGTLWAKDFLRDEEGNIMYLTFREAKKHQLPTIEQFDELKDSAGFHYFCFTLLDGEQIVYPSTGFFNGNSHEYPDEVRLWLKSEEDESHKALWAGTETICYHRYVKTGLQYVGHKLPIVVVKSK